MYEQITTFENLLLAFKKAAKGKRGRKSVAVFEHRLEENLLALQHALRDKTYKPGQYRSFYIHEPKQRLISAAPFCDRVVHQMTVCVVGLIMRVMATRWGYAKLFWVNSNPARAWSPGRVAFSV